MLRKLWHSILFPMPTGRHNSRDVSAFWQFPLGEELVVARADIQGLFLLNSGARLLWEKWTAGTSLDETVRYFADVVRMPRDLVRPDVEAILADWSSTLLAAARKLPARTAPVAPDPSACVTIDCVLNGRGFRVLLEAGDLVDEILPRLAHTVVSGQPPGGTLHTFLLFNGDDRIFVFRDGLCIAEETKTGGARVILLQEMTRLCSSGRESMAILHAGACGTGSACILLAGASHAGKTTLCAALMAKGLYCYSDDSAVIDRECRVAGMPFPLMLRKSGWPLLASRSLSIEHAPVQHRWGEDFRLLPSNLPADSSPSVPAIALVFVDYQPTATTCLQPLTPFEALLEFQKSGFWVEHDRGGIARFLAWISRLDRYKLTYSGIDDAVDAVGAFLD